MKKSVLLAIASVLVACAGRVSKTEFADEAPNPDFTRGLKALEREDFSTAAEAFDRLLVNKPGREADLLAVYNSGAAYEGLGKCAKAAERYREVVRASAGKFARLEAQALFRLSLAYECLGNDTKTITALIDAQKRGDELPIEITRAELPARLASAYSRIGNRAKAVEYFNQASSGLKALLAGGSSARSQREIMARTLFYMGQLNPSQRVAEGDPVAFLQSLSIQQPYLLQALEMGVNPWSRKAAEHLETALDNLLRFHVAAPEARAQYLTRSLQVLAELRKIRLPDAGPSEDEIFAKVDRTERRIQTELANVAESTRLTPDAERREGLRRQGRAVDPTPRPPAKKGARGKSGARRL